jgi:hypothetical protein
MGMSTRARRARRAAVAGGVVAAVYAGLAVWSGHLSPLARGPLLDGTAPVNYRWVDPPPELAPTNQPPSSGSFSLDLTPKGVKGEVVFTSDNQATVIVATGSIAAKPGQRTVKLTVTPIDAAKLPPPGDGLSVFGNAVRIGASYQPSGDPVSSISQPMDVILVYPALSTLHAANHEMLYSADDKAWQRLHGSDSGGLGQTVEASVPGTGVVMIAGETSASPSGGGSGGRTTIVTILLVIAGCVLLIGIGLLVRSRRA